MTERRADLWSVGTTLAVVAVLGVVIWARNGGVYHYVLDDPYIHLALAEEIARGHYGLHADAYAAPSSSILWPFLLAPLARTPLAEAFPLVLNVLSVCASVLVIRRMVGSLALTALVVICGNLIGLVHLGMENASQQAAVLIALWGALQTRVPPVTWVALLVAPLLRYETLAFVLPMLAWLAWRGERAAYAVGVAIVVLIGAFSGFLYSLGLGFVPSSIAAKGGVGFMGRLGVNVTQPTFFSTVFVAGVALAFGAWKRDVAAAIAGLAALAHCAGGLFGPYGRYEAWVVAPLLVTLIRGLGALPVSLLVKRLMALATTTLFPYFLVWPAIIVMAYTAHTAQWQLRTLLDTYGEPVAINDLGVATWQRDVPVLDLWGLGSFKALEARRSAVDASWMDDLCREDGVEMAIIFDRWFPQRPETWVPVGEMYISGINRFLPSDHFTLYATRPESEARIREVVWTWGETLEGAELREPTP